MALLTFAMVLAPALASAAWQVIPIRLEFDQRNRSGVVTIKNNGEEPISFTVEALRWTQDFAGKDHYDETSDILFFPKQLTIGANQERIIRAGIKVPAVKEEKTYRLFIKQETDQKTQISGSQVAIAIRFGVPIFAKPVEEHLEGEIVSTTIEDGNVEITLKNTGNEHFRVKTINLSGLDTSGNEIFSQAISGNYLLAGSQRNFSTSLNAQSCEHIDTLDIHVTSDRLTLDGEIHVEKAMCTNQ